MTPNLIHINTSIFTLPNSNVLPSFNNSKIIIQPLTLVVPHNFYDGIASYQLLDKQDNCSY
ncbi:MAG TPA: hypothetical protein VGA80_07210 [Flavobacteriaceae bacterium]